MPAVLHPDGQCERELRRPADECGILEEDQALAEPRLVLRVGRRGLLHARDIALPERGVARGRRDGDDDPGDVWMETRAGLEVRADAPPGLLADVGRPRVDAEHPDRARALFAGVRVLVVAHVPAALLEDRPEELRYGPREGAFGRRSDGVVADPRERVGDRGEHRAVVVATQRLEAPHEGGESGLAVTGERPEIVDEAEPLLGGEVRDPLVEPPFGQLVEPEAIEPAPAGVRVIPPGTGQADGGARVAQEDPLFAAVGPDDERHRPALRGRLRAGVREGPSLGEAQLAATVRLARRDVD